MYENKYHIGSKIKRKEWGLLIMLLIVMGIMGCKNSNSKKQEKRTNTAKVHIITLDPGHFHAALIQQSMHTEIDSTVAVFAPDGPDVKAHLALIEQYNHRKGNPTSWREKVYIGADYMQVLLKTKPGNVVVIAGNNQLKTDYIKKMVAAGLNVLADKPMVITKDGFNALKVAFADAEKKKVLIYDVMTMRYEITNILQKIFFQSSEVFGELQKGNLDSPAITNESVHYFFKKVSGIPLIRPTWYFDVAQEGEGIVDVTTHLVDLIQWECFSEVVLDGKRDIQMLDAKHSATILTPSQFRRITQSGYPDFLLKNVKDSLLHVYANGEMNYTIKDIHAKVAVTWKFEAPDGIKDTYFSKLCGTKANLIIRQGKEQQYLPVLYIESIENKERKSSWEIEVKKKLISINKKYPGISLKKKQEGWEVVIPEKYSINHEAQFSLVVKQYLQYMEEGKLPEWEISYMLTKYYTTTLALERAIH